MTQTVSTSYLSTHQMPVFLNPLQMAYFFGESRAERKVINLKSEMLISDRIWKTSDRLIIKTPLLNISTNV